jgi:hypothetical protein
MYCVVFAMNLEAIASGYNNDNNGSLFCGSINSASIPIYPEDIVKASDDSLASGKYIRVVKVTFYYFNR